MTTLQSLEEWNAPTTDVYTHGGKFHFSLSKLQIFPRFLVPSFPAFLSELMGWV